MADLARIKRNVAKMASMNAPETDIDNYIASEGVTVDDVRNFKPLELSDAQKQQIAANNTAYEQRQEENRPFWDKNPVGRLAIAGMQGIANAGLNPAGYVARAYGIDTKPFTPQNAAERGTELAGQYGYDAAALGGIGNIAKGAGYLGKGEKLGSKIAQSVLAPENIATMAIAPAAGGGIAEGITNPTNEFERTVANIVGAMTPAAAQGAFAKTKQTITTGLKGILGDNKANAAVSKGIRASENVAQQVADDAPAAYNELNNEMAKALDDAAGRKLNITNANASQQQRYNDFIRDNADVELYSPKSAQEQSAENFNRWFKGSQVVDENGQPLKLYHGTRANFDTFDLGKSGQSNGGISKIGVWMTPEEQIAKEFSNTWYGGDNPRVMQMYVDMKNPKVYKSVDNTKALKKIESDIDNVNNKMQKINSKLSNSELSQLRGFMQYDDYDEIAKMYGYSPETAKNAKDYWNLDKQLDDLLFEQRNLKANDAYDQLLNDLDEYSEFVMHTDGVKDFRRGSHTSRIAIKNPDEAVAKLKDRLKKEGYDGIIVENTNRDTDVIGKNASQYVAFEPNQIKSVNNSGAWSSSPSLSDAGWTPKAGLKQFTQGLDDFQKDALNQALSKGASMSTSAKGTLGATHRAQEVLNDMIDASYDTSIIGQRKPTTETRQLMTVKERLNQILEPSGVKPYDAGISKAKALQANFEKGYNFKPSEIKFENIGLNTLRDRKAFLQGRIQKILDNTLSDGGTNLATAIKKDENTLRKLLPASKFDNLMSKANQIETNFKRLKSLEGQANNRLVRDSQQGSSPWRENIESKGSIIGRSLDVLSGLLNRRGNTNLANQYLGNSNQVVTRGGLKGAFTNAAQTGLRQALIEAMDNN